MPKEEPPLLHRYDFLYSHNLGNYSYFFETSSGIIYEVKFKQSGYVFADKESFSDRVFEFSIVMLENPLNKKTTTDNLIPNTIASIFLDFFEKTNPIVVYICDTSDTRGAARNRKFNQWFDLYRGNVFFKIDMPMGQDRNGQTYFTSMILRIDDSEADKVVSAFRKLVLSNQK